MGFFSNLFKVKEQPLHNGEMRLPDGTKVPFRNFVITGSDQGTRAETIFSPNIKTEPRDKDGTPYSIILSDEDGAMSGRYETALKDLGYETAFIDITKDSLVLDPIFVAETPADIYELSKAMLYDNDGLLHREALYLLESFMAVGMRKKTDHRFKDLKDLASLSKSDYVTLLENGYHKIALNYLNQITDKSEENYHELCHYISLALIPFLKLEENGVFNLTGTGQKIQPKDPTSQPVALFIRFPEGGSFSSVLSLIYTSALLGIKKATLKGIRVWFVINDVTTIGRIDLIKTMVEKNDDRVRFLLMADRGRTIWEKLAGKKKDAMWNEISSVRADPSVPIGGWLWMMEKDPEESRKEFNRFTVGSSSKELLNDWNENTIIYVHKSNEGGNYIVSEVIENKYGRKRK